MLIKRVPRIITQLELQLFFDDNTEKKDVISVDDIIDITFRRKNKKERKTGIVKDIRPIYAFPNRRIGDKSGEYASAILEIDFSEEYKSGIYRISTFDIIDYNILRPTDEVVIPENKEEE